MASLVPGVVLVQCLSFFLMYTAGSKRRCRWPFFVLGKSAGDRNRSSPTSGNAGDANMTSKLSNCLTRCPIRSPQGTNAAARQSHRNNAPHGRFLDCLKSLLNTTSGATLWRPIPSTDTVEVYGQRQSPSDGESKRHTVPSPLE